MVWTTDDRIEEDRVFFWYALIVVCESRVSAFLLTEAEFYAVPSPFAVSHPNLRFAPNSRLVGLRS